MVTIAFTLMGRYGRASLQRGLVWTAHLRQMGMVALLLLAGSYLGRDEVVSRVVLLVFLGLYTLLAAWALDWAHGLHRRLTRGYFTLERTLLVGTEPLLAAWLESGQDLRTAGIDVVGYLTDDASDPGRPALGGGEVPWLGTADRLADLVERHRVSQVAFWQRPGPDADLWTTLAALRGQRIRLRWILDEAWLLAVGARADRFGRSPSGVLDPDDGLAVRRGLLRPLEVLVGSVLVLVSLAGWPSRRRRRRRGDLCATEVDRSAGRPHHGHLTIETDPDGWPLPIWSQTDLARALVTGRVGLVGAPLRPDAALADPARLLTELDTLRPGLTGAWARSDDAPATGGSAWRTFFLNPGGWGRPAPSSGTTAPRASGEEVQRS